MGGGHGRPSYHTFYLLSQMLVIALALATLQTRIQHLLRRALLLQIPYHQYKLFLERAYFV